MSGGPVRLAGIASAYPGAERQLDLWDDYFASHFAGVRGARRAFFSTGVERRHAVANPRVEDVSRWSTEQRMTRYLAEALPLAKEAVSAALETAGLGADEIGLLVVVSCTGYVTPGVDVHLARDLAMSPSTERLLLGHMGCHAALPGLRVAADYVSGHDTPALVCCVELSSLHLRPPVADLGQVVVHSLFGDAAAAVALVPSGYRPGVGLSLLDLAARSDLAAADSMTWVVTDQGFAMTLDRHVPQIVAKSIEPLVTELLERHGLRPAEIAHWAVHPGGPRILDVVAERLGLPDSALASARQVLATRGNCSSATLLLVLQELASTRPFARGEYVVALGFGPGMSLYAGLLRAD